MSGVDAWLALRDPLCRVELSLSDVEIELAGRAGPAVHGVRSALRELDARIDAQLREAAPVQASYSASLAEVLQSTARRVAPVLEARGVLLSVECDDTHEVADPGVTRRCALAMLRSYCRQIRVAEAEGSAALVLSGGADATGVALVLHTEVPQRFEPCDALRSFGLRESVAFVLPERARECSEILRAHLPAETAAA